MTSRWGTCVITRPGEPATSPLRAWSAADVLVLDQLAAWAPDGIESLGRVLIVNDDFGGLYCALAASRPTVWTDSARSRSAIEANAQANGLSRPGAEQTVVGSEQPAGPFDTVIVRVPKSLALLEHQLAGVRAGCHDQTRIVGTGMARHIHTSTLELFERWLGPTTTSKATRKARLIHTEFDSDLDPPTATTPGGFTVDGLKVVEQPGTFSAGHLDVGTALLVETLAAIPPPAPGAVVADLGCGNGVLAASAARSWPGASFLLVDASDLAVAAAQATWAANDLAQSMQAYCGDGFDQTSDRFVDVVISNPPFHHGHALDNTMTDQLLQDMARVLTPTGMAYIVVQRHLQLHNRLSRWFERVTPASKHASHVVLIAERPRSAP